MMAIMVDIMNMKSIIKRTNTNSNKKGPNVGAFFIFTSIHL